MSTNTWLFKENIWIVNIFMNGILNLFILNMHCDLTLCMTFQQVMLSFKTISSQQSTIKISSPLFSIFSLAAILVGSRDHRTQFWKGAIQGPFHQSLVQIGPAASEELIKM
jgi:hypothetical protein